MILSKIEQKNGESKNEFKATIKNTKKYKR